MKTKDSSGKKKYDSWKTRLARGLRFKINFNSGTVDGSLASKSKKAQGEKECLFVSISFIYQNYIKRSATQCFLSVTN